MSNMLKKVSEWAYENVEWMNKEDEVQSKQKSEYFDRHFEGRFVEVMKSGTLGSMVHTLKSDIDNVSDLDKFVNEVIIAGLNQFIKNHGYNYLPTDKEREEPMVWARSMKKPFGARN